MSSHANLLPLKKLDPKPTHLTGTVVGEAGATLRLTPFLDNKRICELPQGAKIKVWQTAKDPSYPKKMRAFVSWTQKSVVVLEEDPRTTVYHDPEYKPPDDVIVEDNVFDDPAVPDGLVLNDVMDNSVSGWASLHSGNEWEPVIIKLDPPSHLNNPHKYAQEELCTILPQYKSVTKTAPTFIKCTVISESGAHIRSGPMMSSKYIGHIPKGTVVVAQEVIDNKMNEFDYRHEGYVCDSCSGFEDIRGKRYKCGSSNLCGEHYDKLGGDGGDGGEGGEYDKEDYKAYGIPASVVLMNRRVYVEVVEDKLDNNFEYLGPFKFNIGETIVGERNVVLENGMNENFTKTRTKLAVRNPSLRENLIKQGVDLDVDANESNGGVDYDDKKALEKTLEIEKKKKLVHGGWVSLVSSEGYIILQQENELYNNVRVDKVRVMNKKSGKDRDISDRELGEINDMKSRMKESLRRRSEKNLLLDYTRRKNEEEIERRREWELLGDAVDGLDDGAKYGEEDWIE
jgi:hypothetical protein